MQQVYLAKGLEHLVRHLLVAQAQVFQFLHQFLELRQFFQVRRGDVGVCELYPPNLRHACNRFISPRVWNISYVTCSSLRRRYSSSFISSLNCASSFKSAAVTLAFVNSIPQICATHATGLSRQGSGTSRTSPARRSGAGIPVPSSVP